jgi:glycosyltransferase involved in cell wall biosynthesis/putative flippase GtrA
MMQLQTRVDGTARTPARIGPVLDVTVPVYNEEWVLADSVRRLDDYLTASFPFTYRITIADNGSTDSTLDVADELSDRLPHVRVVHLDQKGRGRALNEIWSTSDAEVLAYMDVDLSTGLDALLPLVAPLLTGHSDIAIGTRLARGSRVVRGPKREFISRSYNVILRGALSATFSDAQCGFKAIRSDVARSLLPLVQDRAWFFDTELLVLAERAGLRIHEVPVDWVDDPDSRVDIVATAVEDLKGVARLVKDLTTKALPLAGVRNELGRDRGVEALRAAPTGIVGQLASFAVIGVISTLAYLALFWALRHAISAQPANLIALLVTAIGNTAANRRLTFGVQGTGDRTRHHLQGLFVFGIAFAITSLSLATLTHLAPHASRTLEVVVLVAANALATVIRFVAFRVWVFARPSRRPVHDLEPAG